MDKLVYLAKDGEFKPLSSIKSVNLEVSDEDLEKISRIWQSETWECEVQIENQDEFEKQVVYGGDKGLYNGHVLQRDGYLSPKNGWINGST